MTSTVSRLDIIPRSTQIGPACRFRPHESRSKALVVDDDAGVRVLVKRILSRNNFEVDTARDGGEAIEMIQQNEKPFDVDLLVKEATECYLVQRRRGLNKEIAPRSLVPRSRSRRVIIHKGAFAPNFCLVIHRFTLARFRTLTSAIARSL